MINTLSQKIKTYLRNRKIIAYKPQNLYKPDKILEVVSAWRGHEAIILDIIKQFNLNTNSCLEFGVEFGYSAVVFSNYFEQVSGVDTFLGDTHTFHKGDHYEQTKQALAEYQNIQLFKSDYKDWIEKDRASYDLIHVDIIHTYEDTYACGLWSAEHSACTIFHDTDSFPDVRRAVYDIAKNTKKKFYNYPKHYGLGIVV